MNPRPTPLKNTTGPILAGVARTLDLWGLFSEHRAPDPPAITDAKALACDWATTGADLWAVIGREPSAPQPTQP